MQWAPRTGEVVATAAAGLGLALAVLLVDPIGRLLIGGAALLLLGLAVRDAVLRPRLHAGADGVTVRGLSGSTTIPWPQQQVASGEAEHEQRRGADEQPARGVHREHGEGQTQPDGAQRDGLGDPG